MVDSETQSGCGSWEAVLRNAPTGAGDSEEAMDSGEVLELVAAARATVERILGFLAVQCRAKSGGAVLLVGEQDLEITATTHRLGTEHLRTAATLWRAKLGELRAGRVVSQSSDLLAPLCGPDSELLALILLVRAECW